MAARGASLLCLLGLLLALPLASAGGVLPVLRAQSPQLDVRDGDWWLKGVWVADPAIRLDVYRARRCRGAKRVTFVSDRDSLSFDVRPGEAHDFVVLLAGRDSCRTRLSTLAQGAQRMRTGSAGPDTIPITIAHGKLHVRGSFNDSRPLDLVFDTGADACVLYPSAARKGARVAYDDTVINTGTGGSTVRRTSSDNRLELSGLRWTHVGVIEVEKQADDADGIVGYPVFEDRVIEFDFGRMVMVVRDSLPGDLAGFQRTPLYAAGSLTAVELGFHAGALDASGPFVLDTAGNGALIVNPAFAAAHGLRAALRRLGSSRSGGVGAGVVRNDIELLPELVLAGFTLRDVPIHVQRSVPGAPAPPGGALCTEVLRRFDVVLDYPHGAAWFRPNARFRDRFPTRGGSNRLAVAIAIGSGIAAALVAGTRRRSRRPAA